MKLSKAGRISGKIAIALWTSMATGCMVGPNYKGPPPAAPASSRATAFHRATTRSVSNDAPTLAHWWTALDDKILDQLENQALKASPTLEESEAHIRNARASVNEKRADLLPTGGPTAAYARIHIPSETIDKLTQSSSASGSGTKSKTPSSYINFYDETVDASWQLDLWGATRRQVAAAHDNAQYQIAELEDAQVVLTADVAHAYVNLRDSQHRAALSKTDHDVEARIYEITKLRRAGGTATDLDVERALYQLNQSDAQAIPLKGQIEVYADEIAELTGQEPGAVDDLIKEARDTPLPPAQTAVGDPAAMLRRRPDIRAAERELASNSEMIGFNVAQYFPTVNLLGGIGYTSARESQLLSSRNFTYFGAPVLSWNLFEYPKIHAEVAEAEADYEAAKASYRGKVLSALLDAENSLSRFGNQRENVGALSVAADSAQRSAMLAKERYSGGTLSLQDSLDIERQRIDSVKSLAQAQAELTNDWVSLQSSMGLGWDTTPMNARN